MKRTNKAKAKDDGTVLFRKTGGGSFRTKTGKIVKPNETFRAKPEDIPKGFRDTIVALEPLPDEDIQQAQNFDLEKAETSEPTSKNDTTVNVDEEGYGIEKREGDGDFYNVINAQSGKPMNEKPLEKEQAETLLKSLNE